MGQGRFVRSFEELIVYEKAFAIARRVFQLSAAFPREERYALTDQIRRASRSIGAQIAEAWGKRRYPRHFVSKLTDADAEHLETRHWVRVAAACGLLTTEEEAELMTALEEVGRMLHAMMTKAQAFSNPFDTTMKDPPADYLTTNHSPLTTNHSPLTTHHSPLPTHHSPLTTNH